VHGTPALVVTYAVDCCPLIGTLYEPPMPKSRRNAKRAKGSRRSSMQRGVTAMARPLTKVPRPVNNTVKIRRSWTQVIDYFGTQGWFNSGNPDFQINFACSASNINIGGVAVYGPATPNSAEFANLYDQYRLAGITLRIDWDYNSYSPATGSAVAPLLYYAADYDDSGSTLVSGLLQYPGLVTHSFLENGYKPLITSVRPKVLRDVASTGLLTAYAPATAPWISTGYMTVPHYGLKFCSSQFGLGGSSLSGSITITCFIDLEFANPK